ncbi:adenosylcobinamide-GDP ribazoletransferase [Microlunatus aurantiacus]|uniref:Adenosylcobinamide-GDP ribazoletransferase n=1 Tax=Microlunatus aurantiacus TaxID=446786 RepID=A0ABP7DA70_9ACTN
MSWVSAWRLAVGTLTVIPVRPPETVDRTTAGRAMTLAPLAVLPLAAVAAGLGRVAALTSWPPLLAGLVVVAVLAIGTRALHLDGLADTVDGLGSGREPVRALEIMRRGDVGPMGVVALLLVLGGQTVAASALVDATGTAVLLVVLIASSRVALLVACRAGVTAARPGGLGATVAGTVRRPVLVGVGGMTAVAVAGASVLAGAGWWSGVAAVVAAAFVAYVVVRRAVARLGGITGDVLGAVVELTLLTLLLATTLVGQG